MLTQSQQHGSVHSSGCVRLSGLRCLGCHGALFRQRTTYHTDVLSMFFFLKLLNIYSLYKDAYVPGLLRRGCFGTRLQCGLVGAGQVARRFSASLRELRSRFVPETAPLEGSAFLDLQGPFAAAASERAQAGISCATPFDGERTHFKKPVSVTMACGAVPQQKEKACQVFFFKNKVCTLHSAWSLVQHHVQVKVCLKLYRSVGRQPG